MSIYHLQPITQREAFDFIREHHRTHLPPYGWIFGLSVGNGEKVVGVLVAGRPVARVWDDGWTIEIVRCCVLDNLPRIVDGSGKDHAPSISSMLYSASVRVSVCMGYKRVITYILKEETGISLKAAGWKYIHDTDEESWHRKSRPRVDHHPTGQKQLWEAVI